MFIVRRVSGQQRRPRPVRRGPGNGAPILQGCVEHIFVCACRYVISEFSGESSRTASTLGSTSPGRRVGPVGMDGQPPAPASDGNFRLKTACHVVREGGCSDFKMSASCRQTVLPAEPALVHAAAAAASDSRKRSTLQGRPAVDQLVSIGHQAICQ